MPSSLPPTVSVSRRRLWRCLPRAFAQTALESGPSFTMDRRYSIQGEFGAVYLSASKELAQWEAERHAGPYAEPMAYLEFELSIAKLVDLRLPTSRAYFKVSLEHLVMPRTAADRYVSTQKVARRVYGAKLHGLLAPSVHDPDGQKENWFNIVLYPAHLLQFCLRPIV